MNAKDSALTAFGALVATVTIFATTERGEDPPETYCDDPREILATYEDHFGEITHAILLDGDAPAMFLLIDPLTSSWTLLRGVSGELCIADSGAQSFVVPSAGGSDVSFIAEREN